MLNTPQPSILPVWKSLFVFRPFCLKHGAIIGFRSVEPSTSGSSNLVSVPPVRPEGWLLSHISLYTCRRPFQVRTKPSWTAGTLSHTKLCISPWNSMWKALPCVPQAACPALLSQREWGQLERALCLALDPPSQVCRSSRSLPSFPPSLLSLLGMNRQPTRSSGPGAPPSSQGGWNSRGATAGILFYDMHSLCVLVMPSSQHKLRIFFPAIKYDSFCPSRAVSSIPGQKPKNKLPWPVRSCC